MKKILLSLALILFSLGCLAQAPTWQIDNLQSTNITIKGPTDLIDLTSLAAPSIYFHTTQGGNTGDSMLRYRGPNFGWTFYDYNFSTNASVITGPLTVNGNLVVNGTFPGNYWQSDGSGGVSNLIQGTQFAYDVGGGGIVLSPGLSANVVLGGNNDATAGNSITPANTAGTSIGGGGGNTVVGTGPPGPTASNNASYIHIGGGYNNSIQNSEYATLSGGLGNLMTNAFAAVIGGGFDNIAGAQYSTIAGGRANFAQALYSYIGGGYGNQISSNGPGVTYADGTFDAGERSVIAGGSYGYINAPNCFMGVGSDNNIYNGAYGSSILSGDTCTIMTNAYFSTIAGGYNHSISGIQGFVGGGYKHTIATNCNSGVVGGGYNNSIYSPLGSVLGGYQSYIYGGSDGSTVGGGSNNFVLASSPFSVVSGGNGNQASGAYGTVPGGSFNVAGAGSFAAGQSSLAYSNNTLVWNDNGSVPYTSPTNNIVAIHSQNGLRLDGGSFIGSGAGLTGTAASLTAGAVSSISGNSVSSSQITTGLGYTPLTNTEAGVTNTFAGHTLPVNISGTAASATTATTATNANVPVLSGSSSTAPLGIDSSGKFTTNSVSSGGSQTPWTGNINAGGYSLSNVASITTSNTSGSSISGVGLTNGAVAASFACLYNGQNSALNGSANPAPFTNFCCTVSQGNFLTSPASGFITNTTAGVFRIAASVQTFAASGNSIGVLFYTNGVSAWNWTFLASSTNLVSSSFCYLTLPANCGIALYCNNNGGNSCTNMTRTTWDVTQLR